MGQPVRSRRWSRLGTLAADVVRRLSAVVCLVSAYLSCRIWSPPFTESRLDIHWWVVSAGAALIVATGPLQWADPLDDPQPLRWPGGARLWCTLILGWALML